MSSKSKSSRPHEVAKLVEEVSQLTDDEAYTLHGIEYYTDGGVYDTIEDIDYASLAEWAEAQISAIYETKFQKRQSPHAYEE
jgi:hypothetical protein